ncbi:TLC domain-containing protein 4-B isoform X1 [Latimeria chalumnae]|nr:PREDICTED: transmembrane protein 56-B-like isoform X1 [Latimeria chalumnae]XP_006005761.1 PREDICTED: transmembrane protein 56-B-like isoform X1 [Latimeria chalumnae]XP_006005762.1 PREDICTED: transmembrane protein 56-B-like isoform X1 [Latimeria chalumnae]XP_014349806.1 PREDICTED: transmembrane protein 56-B-like isoform X1 [Latimeria chalumnae]XP_014349807.1 PREDICTED: transmembrane protein 56-B-like isoform X1 [Latimeria chalumnae]XP_014349808.1 PREDICTED: transmembrane protein 56-B-like is|eukprot:XP_006005760.1 PREDICTED: transmembrane protein 56-B-like isoform X1 [Latimeria chalumnae]
MDTFKQLILGIALASFTIFQVAFHFLSSWCSERLAPGFNTLNKKQKIEWNSRTVSTLHALVVGAFCLYILWFDDAVNADPVWGDATLVKINVAITTGYLISDLLLIIYYWNAIGDKFFVAHHLAALYAYYYVLGQGLLPYFANFRLLAEFSTPCVNQRWFFDVLGYPKSSKPNIVNGVTMTIMFFLVRIAVIPVYYGRMISTFGTEAFHRLGRAAQCAWIISSISLDIMNIMWMHKIARGCYKVLVVGRKQKVAIQKNGKLD